MKKHPEERLVVARLRALVEERAGSVAALEERLGSEPGALRELSPEPGEGRPLDLRTLYEVLDELDLDPREFFCQIYELVPRAGSAVRSDPAGGGDSGVDPEGFPPFPRVLDAVRLLVRDAVPEEKFKARTKGTADDPEEDPGRR